MKTQKGSALIGVLSLSLAMTIAAGGYVMVASNVGRSIPEEEARTQMQYDTESALRLGLRWMKTYSHTLECATWPTSLVLTQQGTDEWIPLNDSFVKISLEPGTPSGGCRTIRAVAKRGLEMERVELSIQINSFANPTSSTSDGPQALSDLNLDQWTETILPGI